MKFTPTWYKSDFVDVPTFQELDDMTGKVFDPYGNYIGPKERPDLQLVVDGVNGRQYFAPKEYDDDAVKYALAKFGQTFSPKEWWGMVHDPFLTTGEKISVAYLELLKRGGKFLAQAPTETVAGVSGVIDAAGIDAGNLLKALNPVAYFASNVARKGIKATAQDYVDLFKNIKTPAGQMGETAALYRASAQNWEKTLDKYLPDVDDNIKAHSTLVTISSMAGQVGGSLLMAAAASSTGGLALVAGAFGSQQFYQLREEYLEKGYSLQSANIFAGMGALAEGGLEAAGFNKWLKYATLKPSLRNHLIAGFMEASQEAAQTTAEEALTNLTGVRQETLTEILAQIAISAVAGFIPGAGLSLMGGGIGIRREKAVYELDRAAERMPIAQEQRAQLTQQTQAAEQQEIVGQSVPEQPPAALQEELKKAKANKGSNPLYETVRNIANSYGVIDEKAIDAFYAFARNQRVQGALGEELLEGLGKQIVAYNEQLLRMDKASDEENKKAAAAISYHLSEEAVNKFRENTKTAAQKIGLDETTAEVVAESESRIYRHLSQEFGEDLQQLKAVEILVPSATDEQAPTAEEILAEAQTIDGQIEELKKLPGTDNQVRRLEQEKGRLLSRGSIRLGETVNKITLSRFSDGTTIKHELMHHWTDIVDLMAARGNKKAQRLRKVMDKIAGDNAAYVAQDVQNARQRRAEAITEAYEAWLYSGMETANRGEQSLFNAIKRYFQSIYRSVQEITGIRINPEIDRFFKQMTGVERIADANTSVETLRAEGINPDDLYFQQPNSYDAQGKARTDTPQFKAWFAGSKVVDENGKPLVVYHGTKSDFGIFDLTKGGRSNEEASIGFWFSPSKDVADNFVKGIWYGDKEKKLMPLYLNLKNPKIYEAAKIDYAALNKLNERITSLEEENNALYNKTGMGNIRRASSWMHLSEEDFLEASKYMDKEDAFNARKFLINEKELAKLRFQKEKIVKNDAYHQYQNDLDLFSEFYFHKYGSKDYVSGSHLTGAGRKNAKQAAEKLREKLIKEGYDGIIIKDTKFDAVEGKPVSQIVAFFPEQIKSVYNRGTWDADNPNIYYQTAYHGSPHRFDAFSTDAIGTGEGAQAHGWGLYFAQNRDVSEGYKSRLAKRKANRPSREGGFWLGEEKWGQSDVSPKAPYYIGKFLKDVYGNTVAVSEEEYNAAYEKAKQEYAELIKKGQVYEVDIPENDVLLDEQKTFNEQPEKVRSALKKIAQEPGSRILRESIAENETGGSLYRAIVHDNADFLRAHNEPVDGVALNTTASRNASEILLSEGVEGITYDGAQDGRGYVIFDDKAIEVLNTFYQRGRAGGEDAEIQKIISDTEQKEKEFRTLEEINLDLDTVSSEQNEAVKKQTEKVLRERAEAAAEEYFEERKNKILSAQTEEEMLKAAGIADDLQDLISDYQEGNLEHNKKELLAYLEEGYEEYESFIKEYENRHYADAEYEAAEQLKEDTRMDALVSEKEKLFDSREELVLSVARATGWDGEATGGITGEASGRGTGRSNISDSRYITLKKGGTEVKIRLSDHADVSRNGPHDSDITLYYNEPVQKNANDLIALLDEKEPYQQEAAPDMFTPDAQNNQNPSFAEELAAVLKAAPNKAEKAVVGKVSPQLSTAAKEHGLNIDGYIHNIDTSAVQHTRKRHGIPQREERRGQLAVTDDDFKNIPQIIYNPDFVAFGAKNNKGLDLIIYGKNMPDGSSVYVEEVRTGKKTLTTNSLRKYKTGVNPSSFAKRISNAHGDTGTISIVGKEDFVKPENLMQDDSVLREKEQADKRQLYQTMRAQQTGAQAADNRPSDEQIEKDLAAIRANGIEKYERESRIGFSLGNFAKDIVLTIRQRAGAVDKRLKAFFDKLDYFEANIEQFFASQTQGFFKKYKALSETDKDLFDYYAYNQLTERLRAFVKEKGMEKEYQQVRHVLDFIYAVSNRAGIDMGYIGEYFPTSLVDYAGFMDHMRGTDKWTYIEKSLREMDPDGLMSEKERADAVNKIIRGYNRTDPVSKPGGAKERKILYKSPELMRFYERSDKALMKYLSSMGRAIAINRAYGKGMGFNTDETIGAIVLDLIKTGTITRAEETEIKSLLKSRLSYSNTPAFVVFTKNIGYLQTMNNFTSAITQLGDLYAPIYKYGFSTAIEAMFGKTEITRKDLGLDKIWEEFSDKSKTGAAVDKLFKVIGLNAMDGFGKKVAINASLINLRKQAQAGNEALLERLAYTFGKEAGTVLKDIKAGRVTTNVKILAWADLADTQPIGKSGMPAAYWNNPHGRLFYQLKTYTTNQISLFYADCILNIGRGIQHRDKKMFLKGVQNLFKLMILLTAGNATGDVLKNLIMGRHIDVSDVVVSNLLWNIGLSKYTFYQGKRMGYATALWNSFVLPPMLSSFDSMYREVGQLAKGKKELKDTYAVTYFPFGRAYYWWFGGGRTQEREDAKERR